jgi:hypothetical protein
VVGSLSDVRRAAPYYRQTLVTDTDAGGDDAEEAGQSLVTECRDRRKSSAGVGGARRCYQVV